MYEGVSVLDVHGHVSVPRQAYALVTSMIATNTPMKSPIGRPAIGRNVIPVEQYQAAAQMHADYMDERNIDVQLIGPRPYLQLGFMQEHLVPSWARIVNDMIHQQVQFFPDRFVGACQLPQLSHAPDTTHCLEELNRCVGEYGFAAAYVGPDPAGDRSTPGMHEPYWYPLYARCEELGIPLIVHGTNSADRRFGVVPNNYQLGFLIEQYLAGQFLSHSDVFERFPGLKVVICHCGGALNRFIPTDAHLAQKDLSNNLFYDSCGYDEIFLEAAIKQRGVSQICFGSESPGSGRAVRPETGRSSDDLVPVIDAMPFLSDKDKIRIFHDNVAGVLPKLAEIAKG